MNAYKKSARTLYLTSLTIILFSACKKEIKNVLPTDVFNTNTSSFVRVVHAAPSIRTLFNSKDSFNVFYADGKMNGAFLTYGSVFPSTTYAGIFPGTISFSLRDNNPAVAAPPILHAFTQQIEPQAYHSLIITDSIRSSNTARQMFIRDNFTTPQAGTFGIRFVHTVWNDTAGRTIDVYSQVMKQNIFNNLAPGAVTDFRYLILPPTTDTLIVRRSGTSFELARLQNFSYGNTRVSTYIYRGNGNTPPSGAASARPRGIISYFNL
jgi:hypothetical protein